MRASRVTSVFACGLFAAAFAACGSNPPPEPANAAGVTSAQTTDARSSAWQLAAARCKHAAACNQIGGDRDYASSDACMAQNRGKAENDVRVSNCPSGVNTMRLQACISQIESQACSGIGSGWEADRACRTGALCP